MKIAATKLENPDIRFVSLVERGANRVPFRIIKSEERGMIDLNKVFKLEKPQAADPEGAALVGIAITKSDDTPEVVAAIKAAGFPVDFKTEYEDGTVVYAAKADTDVTAVTPVKMTESAIALVSGLDVAAIVEKSDMFSDFFNEYKFLPGFDMAMSALEGGVEFATKSEKAEEVSVGIAKSAHDFAAYASSLSCALPAEVLQVTAAVQKACDTKVTKSEAELAADADAAALAIKAEADAAELAAKAEFSQAPTTSGASAGVEGNAGMAAAMKALEAAIAATGAGAGDGKGAALIKAIQALIPAFNDAPVNGKTEHVALPTDKVANPPYAIVTTDESPENQPYGSDAQVAATVASITAKKAELEALEAELAEKKEACGKKKPDGDEAAGAAGEEAESAEEEAREKMKAKKEEDDAALMAVTKSISELAAAVGNIQKSLGAVTDLTDAIATVQKSVEETQGQVAGIASRVESVEKSAKDAHDSISGIVVSQPPAGDNEPSPHGVKKSENDEYSGGLIDTAFMPGRNRARKSAGRN